MLPVHVLVIPALLHMDMCVGLLERATAHVVVCMNKRLHVPLATNVHV